MAAGQSGGGMMDLEKELSCSICTDLLYQPLTLLDCLHTFCGACLKEWFSWQVQSATGPNPFTCPSCRASVRGTKPNATVTTLLDMYLQANPDKGKTDQEKEDMRKTYKPGDNVLPKVRPRREDPEEDEDQRLMEEVRQISLAEVGVGGDRLAEPRPSRRMTERSRERRERELRARHGGDPHSSREGRTFLSYDPEAQSRSRSRNREASRRIEHQSSLRSLLSASELDSREMEEEIMRQIMEEGLLDGIDLNNIDVSQEDEISERIAQAYRRRQRQRTEHRERERARPAGSQARDSSRRRQHTRSESSTQQSQPSRPPVSRPHLFEAMNHPDTGQRHRRSSSQGSVPSNARGERSSRASLDNPRPSGRASSDLTARTPASSDHRRRMSQDHRRATDPERVPAALVAPPHSAPRRSSPASNPASPGFGGFPIGRNTPPSSASPSRHPGGLPYAQGSGSATHSSPSLALPRSSTDGVTSSTRPSSSGNSAPRSTLYTEPSISCESCGKSHIEYDLHYNCPKCKSGYYNICLRCYRMGKGCRHWYGFGYAAMMRYQRRAPPGGYPPGHELPHVLTGHRYRRPQDRVQSDPVGTPETRGNSTNDDPATRLQAGVFCDMCMAFANSCYWRCDICNDGAWGFCNDCVNRSRHCTHPLFPVTEKIAPSGSSSPSGGLAGTPTSNPTCPQSPQIRAPNMATPLPPDDVSIANHNFVSLTFSAECNICAYPIPPSHTRYHCPTCNGGDYDVCSSCYQRLVAEGTIHPDDGPKGWRRCLQGHRMLVVGFEDRGSGQRRVVTREPVGGLALKEGREPAQRSGPNGEASWSWRDDDGTMKRARVNGGSSNLPVAGTRFPPDGGVGLRVLALWGYYPADDAPDELMFPRNAEIREAEDINGDWFWGRYAGAKGLFPGNYGRVI